MCLPILSLNYQSIPLGGFLMESSLSIKDSGRLPRVSLYPLFYLLAY